MLHDEFLWIRILYNIRHTLWPGGNLLVDLKIENNSYSQRKLLQEEACREIDAFLPCKCNYCLMSYVVHLLGHSHFIISVFSVFKEVTGHIPSLKLKHF